MNLTPTEIERLTIFQAAELARQYRSLGIRLSHPEAVAKGVWFGLSHGTSSAILSYAVIEGVAFALVDGYRALQAAGTTVETASLVRGGSKSRYWSGLLASALRLPLTRHSCGEVGAAIGAARDVGK